MRLEQAVRDAVDFRDYLFVMTGPLYESEEDMMPNSESHTVPSGYWKIIYDSNGNAAGFVMDQELARNADYCAQGETLVNIARRSGLTLPSLSQSVSVRERIAC